MAEEKTEKSRALDLAVSQIEKQFGKGSIMRLGGIDSTAALDAISSGSISLDAALGVGGYPRGRVIEIFGPESSGKTTLSLHVIAEAQKLGGTAAFVDAEHALDANYARKLGVDVENLLVSQPDSGEQALEITEVLIRSGAIDIVVIDSVAALVPQAEFDIMYAEGIWREGDILDSAVDKNIVEKSGAWFSFQGERLGQGRENARQFLKENPDHRGRIELALREIMGLSIPTVPPPQQAVAVGTSDNGHKRK